MSRGVIYPDKTLLKQWIDKIQDPSVFPPEFLPLFEDRWFDEVVNVVELLKIPHYKEDIHHKCAHLFYKIIKNHYFTDGNKRSSVVVLYLFSSLNGFVILAKPQIMIDIARRTAKSDGVESEDEILKLEEIIRDISIHVSKIK